MKSKPTNRNQRIRRYTICNLLYAIEWNAIAAGPLPDKNEHPF